MHRLVQPALTGIHGLIRYLPEYLMMNARVSQRRKGRVGNRRPWKRSLLCTAVIHTGIVCVRADGLRGREGGSDPFPESTRIKFGRSLSGWTGMARQLPPTPRGFHIPARKGIHPSRRGQNIDALCPHTCPSSPGKTAVDPPREIGIEMKGSQILEIKYPGFVEE